MPLDRTAVREHLRAFRFSELFTQELGWEWPSHPDLQIVIRTDGGNRAFDLTPVAHKRGVVAYHCAIPAGIPFPDSTVRHKIETETAKRVLEHIILFTDSGKTQVILQTAIRRPNEPVRRPEYHFDLSGSGEVLLQRLDRLVFTLEQEEALTVVDVVQRLQSATNAEKVTKKFYDTFAKERQKFTEFISGIRAEGDRAWYASVMLNRLMFVYFIQTKGFLDGNSDYLRDRLEKVRAQVGKNKFHSFYRSFLLRLFHDGLGKRELDRKFDLDLKGLIGRVPYLNGGLFEVHEIEKAHDDGRAITIPDEAFDRLFTFFSKWRWHLDERPLRDEGEINPDVLGYIFEKYINQKQMGAYYTKEDITDYISKNCVVPWLFQRVERSLAVAEDRAAFASWWQGLLRASPDTYIYPALRHGTTLALPSEIEKGIDTTKPKLVERRKDWQKSAPSEFALPTEIWREVVGRRQRYTEVRGKIERGEVQSVTDFVTLNLDIRQFAQDVISRCPEAKWLRHFWTALQEITVLDPTCGSGAFLFAALNLLLPLYEGVLQRMEDLLRDEGLTVPTAAIADAPAPAEKASKTFQRILGEVNDPARHPTRRYFVLKEIILRNLYGVDIMPEAVEICKLRLFLKLVAQVEPDTAKNNLGVEPLPDVDFNVRPGNTLVGFATRQELEKIAAEDFIWKEEIDKVFAAAEDADRLFETFRKSQEAGDSAGQRAVKERLKTSLADLRSRCDRALAEISEPELSTKPKKYGAWRENHVPFHWYVEFYGIMQRGGFAAIIGNPPYAEIPKEYSRSLLSVTYRSILEKWSRDEDLYTLVVERSKALLEAGGGFGMILPLSIAFSTKTPYRVLREEVSKWGGLWYWSHFDRIPSALFGNEVRTRCSIGVWRPGKCPDNRAFFTTSLNRWNQEARDVLFARLTFADITGLNSAEGFPKVGSRLQADALRTLAGRNQRLLENLTLSVSFTDLSAAVPDFPKNAVFIGGTAYNWFPAWREIPETTNAHGEASLPARTAGFRFANRRDADAVFALLCSSLGYWWWVVASDGFNLKRWLIERFPLALRSFDDASLTELAELGSNLAKSLRKQYVYKDNAGRIGNFFLPGCGNEVQLIDDFLVKAKIGLSAEVLEDIRGFNATFATTEDLGESEED